MKFFIFDFIEEFGVCSEQGSTQQFQQLNIRAQMWKHFYDY